MNCDSFAKYVQMLLPYITLTNSKVLHPEDGTICSSEMSILTRSTQHRRVPEDGILHCYRGGNLKSYLVVQCSTFRYRLNTLFGMAEPSSGG
jgi:hypothetical protein